MTAPQVQCPQEFRFEGHDALATMRKVQTSKLQNKLNKPSLRFVITAHRECVICSSKEKNNMGAKPELAPVIDAQTIKAAQEALNNAPSTSDAPGVDKIRELLFGNQMQDYDRRFEVMEQRFQQKCAIWKQSPLAPFRAWSPR